MYLKDAFKLMFMIRKAQKDTSTPVGACYSLQEYLGRDGIVTVGKCLSDGRHALYATSKTKEIPSEYCGFPVINV